MPRKDVAIELFSRLSSIFNKNKVAAVYGGHHNEIFGDLVVLTTHQLYRYKKYFSLIILDEIDAFPFKNNEVLENMFYNSLSGHYVMMSATPSKEVIEHFKEPKKAMLRLDTRFHRHPLPIPNLVTNRTFAVYFELFKYVNLFLKQDKPLFIFAPTIEECENLYRILSLVFKGGECVHSKREFRSEIISEFRKGKYRYLVTTSVLERGVTVKNLQVIVFNAHHKIYDEGTLVQIAGRVGRKIDAPEGEVIFIGKKKTTDMERARENIISSNKALQNML